MKQQYRLIDYETQKTNTDLLQCVTPCPHGWTGDGWDAFDYPAHVGSGACNHCPHYRGTSGKRVKCAYGIDDKRRVM